MVTLAEYQAFLKDEITVDAKKEKELYLNDALGKVIEGLDEG